MFWKGKTGIIAKFHRTDLVICSHSRERKICSHSREENPILLPKKIVKFGRKKLLSYNQINMVNTMFCFVFYRKLHLQLKKDRGVFTDGYQMELSNGTLVDVDLSFLYSGNVKGEWG